MMRLLLGRLEGHRKAGDVSAALETAEVAFVLSVDDFLRAPLEGVE